MEWRTTDRPIDWRSHPRYREIMDYASRGEAPPASLLREAKVELPSGVYSEVMIVSFRVKEKVWAERLRKEALQDVKDRFGTLENAVKAYEFEAKFAVFLLLILLIILYALALTLMPLVTPNGTAILILIFSGFVIYGLYHHLQWEPRLRAAVEDWRTDVFREHTTEQRATYLDATTIRQQLYSMSPREFEVAVAGILRRAGYDARVTDYTSDFGVDAIAHKDGRTYVVQIKRYAQHNLVGRPELQKLQGAMLHQMTDGMIFVTLGHFSKPAQEYGRQQGILLIDGQDLVKMQANGVEDKLSGAERSRYKCYECSEGPCYAYEEKDLSDECPLGYTMRVRWQREEYEED